MRAFLRNLLDDFLQFQKTYNFLLKTYSQGCSQNYYDVIFPWLERCEEVFERTKLKGYGLQRIYGFLAERFLSYWFNRNFRVKEYPIIVKDLSDYK